MNTTRLLYNTYFARRCKQLARYAGEAGDLQQQVLLRLTHTAAPNGVGTTPRLRLHPHLRRLQEPLPRADLRRGEALRRAHEGGRAKPAVAYRNTMVCQVLGHDQRQEQIPARQPRVAARHPLPGRPGCRGHLSERKPRKPLLQRQGADFGRQPQPEPGHQPQPGGRPLGHTYRKHQPAGQPHPGTFEGNSPHGTLRAPK